LQPFIGTRKRSVLSRYEIYSGGGPLDREAYRTRVLALSSPAMVSDSLQICHKWPVHGTGNFYRRYRSTIRTKNGRRSWSEHQFYLRLNLSWEPNHRLENTSSAYHSRWLHWELAIRIVGVCIVIYCWRRNNMARSF